VRTGLRDDGVELHVGRRHNGCVGGGELERPFAEDVALLDLKP
jgi:hypothetical protein